MIQDPSQLKTLSTEQLVALAEEIRQTLITTLSETGGHLGPNLGVVELTLAMHKVFDTPKDKFIWDVSHQSYVHKLLTGRKDRFHTIRTTDGLNGFSLRTESEHDCFGAGHAGTALSAALGMCAARDQRGSDENVVCIFGDAALTNGAGLGKPIDFAAVFAAPWFGLPNFTAPVWDAQAMRFTSNGYPQDMLFAFEYDTSLMFRDDT